MSDQTLVVALAGDEVIEAVLDKVRQEMRKNCFLNPNSSYDWFDGEITWKLGAHDAGVLVKIDGSAAIKAGAAPVEDERQHASGGFYIEPAPPNTVREETGQGIPTMTKDVDGREIIKKVHYKRRGGTVAAMLILCVGMLFGQEVAPALTRTEIIALNAVHQQEEATAEVKRTVFADIAKNHPGYEYNEREGRLVAKPKIEQPKK